jgi:hypothetical protein
MSCAKWFKSKKRKQTTGQFGTGSEVSILKCEEESRPTQAAIVIHTRPALPEESTYLLAQTYTRRTRYIASGKLLVKLVIPSA